MRSEGDAWSGAPTGAPTGSADETVAGESLTICRSELSLERGEVLGRYVVIDRIGVGGMGVVYAAGDLTQRGGNRTYCRWEWGKNEVALWHWDAKKTVDGARAAFRRDYSDKSGEDVAKAMGQIKEQVDKQEAEGKLEVDGNEVDANQAKAVADAPGGAMGAGFQYEAVEGVGDEAVWNKTKRVQKIRDMEIESYDNKLHILVSNVTFQIEVHLEEKRPTKDEAIALAKVVVEGLP